MPEFEEEQQYYGNQVHGGVVVNERVNKIFQAIDFGLDGYAQVQSALKSLPKVDYEKIKPEIDARDQKRRAFILRCNTVNQRKIYNQEYSLDAANIIITYLDSIGQWWYKKPAVEMSGYVSYFNEPAKSD